MAANVIVDTSFVVALVSARDNRHSWAKELAAEFATPWLTCEPVLAECFYVLGPQGWPIVAEYVRRRSVVTHVAFRDHAEPILRLMQKYATVPMSVADACLVRMTEILPDPIILTTDADFRVYRRHGRQVVPCRLP